MKTRTKDRNWQALKFIVKFNLFVIPLYIVLFTGWAFTELQQLTTWLSYGVLYALGADPVLDGFLISMPIKNGTWAAFINFDCTGWKSMLAFFALVMSTSLPHKRKMYGLALLPVIYVINIIRIAFMFFFVRTFDLAYYEIVHAVIWSWGLILTILLLWIVWLKYDFTKIRQLDALAASFNRQKTLQRNR